MEEKEAKLKGADNTSESLAKVEAAILMVLTILYSPSIYPFPDELSDILDPALKYVLFKIFNGNGYHAGH